MKKQPCMVTPANTPNRDTQYLIKNLLFQIEPRIAADKATFLAGKELPEAALVRTLLVATWEQGIPAKLKEKGSTTAHTCTHIYNCFAPAPALTAALPLKSQSPIRMGLSEASADPPDEMRQCRHHCQLLLHPQGNSHIVITHPVE